MNFYWNLHSPLNLLIDLLIITTLFFFLRYFFRKKGVELLPPTLSLAYIVSLLQAIVIYFIFISVVSLLPGLSSFLRIHFAWTLVSLLIPIFFIYIAIRFRLYYLLTLPLIIFGIKYYAEAVEPHNLEIEKINLKSEQLSAPLRIAHISDLQVDAFYSIHERVQSAIKEFKPDLIFFTGDITNHSSLMPEIAAYFKSIATAAPSYFISGNHDYYINFGELAAKTNFKYWDSQAEAFTSGDNRIGIIGLGNDETGNQQLLNKLYKEVRSESDLIILLCHRPDCVYTKRDEQIDLIFAGHTHGGQVALPLLGPPITLSAVPRKIGAGGLHRYRDTWLLVNRGLGMEGYVAPRIRFFARPHLALLTVVPKSGL